MNKELTSIGSTQKRFTWRRRYKGAGGGRGDGEDNTSYTTCPTLAKMEPRPPTQYTADMFNITELGECHMTPGAAFLERTLLYIPV